MDYITLIKTILYTIRVLEELLPRSTGAEKFKVLVQVVEDITGSAVDNIPALLKFVSVVVAGLKAVGVFKSNPALATMPSVPETKM